MFALLSVGCASGLSTSVVSVMSNPPQASIYVDGDFVGSTPSDVSLSRHRKFKRFVEIRKPGYRTITTVLRCRPDHARVFLMSALWGFFFPIAVIVDLTSNGGYFYSPTTISVELERE